ncbi:MAG: hypothetical protein QOF83_2804 [Solirubrobacteraceae bacterium]|jgi:hypothetical protein|nr:hypothetical protein [Solirubrobacteraceae bacterium]
MARRLSVVALIALALLLAAAGAAGRPAARTVARPAIAACAFGTDVSGLGGYLPAAVSSAADSYAATVAAADRDKARTVFTAAAAAYAYGFPQVVERATVKHFPRNEIVSVAALADPSVQTVVAPNVDTAYTVAWLDLTSGPLVVNVPDTGGRFYTFQFLDAFSNAFSYLGTGSTGTHAGAYALVPPGYTGTLPPGLTRIDTPSNTVWLLGRTLVKDASDLPAVKALQQHYTVTPLTGWETGQRQPPVVLDRYPPTFPKNVPTGAQFIAELNQDMNVDPPPSADGCALNAMGPAGVQVPHPTPAQSLADSLSDEAPPLPAQSSDPVANAAIAAGTTAGSKIVAAAATQLNSASRGINDGWEILGNWVGAYGTRYLGRSIVATDLLGANTPQQSIYPIADTDHAGRTLDRGQRYTIRFPRGDLPPVKAFWSLTMYNASYFLVANPINRYAIGDRTAGLHYGADGSLTLYVQPGAPARAAERANWLPAPGGRFHLIMRLYQPAPAALSGAWKPPPIVRVGESAASRARRPLLSRLRVTPRSFPAARGGGVLVRHHGRARLSYHDSQAGVTRFTVLFMAPRPHCRPRRGRSCTVLRLAVRFRHRGRAGANHVLLSGRAHGRRLRPGRYVLRAVTGGAGGAPSSAVISARFRIRPPARRS